MLDDQDLETSVRTVLIRLCEVLYANGYRVVPVAPMMQLLGVPADRAELHEGEFFELDSGFLAQAQALNHTHLADLKPINQTIH